EGTGGRGAHGHAGGVTGRVGGEPRRDHFVSGKNVQTVSRNGLAGGDGARLERALRPVGRRRRSQETVEAGPRRGRRARPLQGTAPPIPVPVDRRPASGNGLLRRSIGRGTAHGSEVHTGVTGIGEGEPSP